MTEEEINKKAEKHCNEVLCNAHEKCNEVIKCRDWRSRRAGFFCGYEQALKDFEKENAELKEQCSILADCNTCVSDCKTENIEIKKQLTKAKEIIEQLLLLPYANNEEVYADVTSYLDEAEQFLKDSEVEKWKK